MDDRSNRYCIIGAGPSGLATARAFSRAGISFDVLERHGDVGGIWNLENEKSPVYESAHFISSKTLSAFDDFPMPPGYPDYPGWRLILDYIRAFAVEHDLRRHVQFGADVERVLPRNGGWHVHLANGEERLYRGIVVAVGHNWDPLMPEYAGSFTGKVYHSFHYKSADEFRGKRVLVVGGGNSGCDIACDAAISASRAFISLRRGYHFLPKHILGKPTDVFFRGGPEPPAWLAQPLLAFLLRLLLGDLTRYGLPRPDHKVLASHPIMNTQLLHHLAHGDITPKPDVHELRGGRVIFTDGSEEDIDVIVYATGYTPAIPFLEQSLSPITRQLFLNIFPRSHRDLFIVGHFETDGAAYPIVSKQAKLIGTLIQARESNPEAAAAFDRKQLGSPPDLSGGIHYISSPRHSNYVQFEAYGHYLDRAVKELDKGRQEGGERRREEVPGKQGARSSNAGTQ
ncbi:MAG: flavin-containing monooxygenase [Gemmatimonadaceae bacterium]